MSIAGKKILVTRPMGQSATIARLLEERQAEVIHFPTIAIVPPMSWDDVDEAIDIYRTYHGVILTSVNAVRFFFNRAVERGLQPGLILQNSVYVVGAKSAEAAASYGIAAKRFPGVTTVKMLTEVLCAMPVAERRFLFPKGNLAGTEIADRLRARGATVDEVVVYETRAAGAPPPSPESASVPAVGIDPSRLRAMLKAHEIDAITFFSPSSVENFLALVPVDELGAAVIAAIGPTTADALATVSVPVHVVPREPSSEELVSALENYFSR